MVDRKFQSKVFVFIWGEGAYYYEILRGEDSLGKHREISKSGKVVKVVRLSHAPFLGWFVRTCKDPCRAQFGLRLGTMNPTFTAGKTHDVAGELFGRDSQPETWQLRQWRFNRVLIDSPFLREITTDLQK